MHQQAMGQSSLYIGREQLISGAAAVEAGKHYDRALPIPRYIVSQSVIGMPTNNKNSLLISPSRTKPSHDFIIDGTSQSQTDNYSAIVTNEPFSVQPSFK